MKAAWHDKYGSPEVISIKEVDKPIPKNDELLIKVYAATVNRTDWGLLYARPYFVRLFSGLFKPKIKITGSDFAGIVESVGEKAKRFKPGDKVMGFEGMGAQSHAEYLTMKENGPVLSMPENISYEVAAASLEGAFYAWVSINHLKPKPGQKVLVNGGTGAIGSSGIQQIKHYGAYVTATCRGEHKDLVKSLGADKIIDYEKEDFTKDVEKYDYVFDAVGKSTYRKCKPLLKEKGIYIPTDGLINFPLTLTTPLTGGKRVLFLIPRNVKQGLEDIKTLVENGSFKPVIDRKYPLDKIVEAFTYVSSQQKVGNVIITMSD